ncbi:YkgJ family cysteine cluster protein [Helicobacter sp. MIT 14-3879]|uniref:YkgJ family cysteine cluster protein n=1 Tax=Helicobacter sp. MIT 14-3879 TaxID=2040649 RepID=UPI000E1EF350|nr:YkgJ family cysteine cluster protein [Helicobacter sp. MIT 14-3879]RDU65614.1 zinc/iron-chelating domain-containing protein [Helicobacter sp. MIT 14-3879]
MKQANGFDFVFDESKCAECGGKCCVGESGYIFLNKNEMERIAKFLNMKFEEFTIKYIRKVGEKYSLIEKEHISGKACIFFDDDKQCTIYNVRPNNCRTFPFWEVFRNNPNGACRECIGVKVKKP